MIHYVHRIALFNAIIVSLVFVHCNAICDYYLAASKLQGAGRGIVLGRNYSDQEIIMESPSLIVDSESSGSWQLNNYVYASNDEGYSMALFGIAMLMNHNPSYKNSENLWAVGTVQTAADQMESHSTYSSVNVIANQQLQAGEEMFTTYGDSDWFEARGIGLAESLPQKSLHDLDMLHRTGHCLSNIFLDQSKLSFAGNGIFANKQFLTGEIVTISPVLLLPRHEVEATANTSLLINYCMTSGESDIAILPIGLSVMANHQMAGRANMRVEWYDWELPSHQQSNYTKNVNQPVDELLASFHAPVDMAYRATRDIQIGEELTISYGERWANDWATHLADLLVWLDAAAGASDSDGDDNKPQSSSSSTDTSSQAEPAFRSSIDLPVDFFPSSWYLKTCVGQSCSGTPQTLTQAETETDTFQHNETVNQVDESTNHCSGDCIADYDTVHV